MKQQLLDKRKVVQPGEYVVSKGDIVISTLLGSCVAACLFDPVEQVIGMNHFLLANKRYARKKTPVLESKPGRYGMHAMELLVNDMLKVGAKRRNIRAKVFGGSNVLPGVSDDDNFYAVGSVNSRFVLEYLKQEKIPVIAQDLNGEHGRVIYFQSSDYSVLVKRISKANSLNIGRRERMLWVNSIEEHEKAERKLRVQFW